MSNVYRVGSMYGTNYFNTAKEAVRCKPCGEEPESVERLDAAEECTRLHKSCNDMESDAVTLRRLLRCLTDVCSDDVLATDDGKAALAYLAKNPAPPADAANRDGGRSYGV